MYAATCASGCNLVAPHCSSATTPVLPRNRRVGAPRGAMSLRLAVWRLQLTRLVLVRPQYHFLARILELFGVVPRHATELRLQYAWSGPFAIRPELDIANDRVECLRAAGNPPACPDRATSRLRSPVAVPAYRHTRMAADNSPAHQPPRRLPSPGTSPGTPAPPASPGSRPAARNRNR